MGKGSTCILYSALMGVVCSCAQAQPYAASEETEQLPSEYPIAEVINEYRAACGSFANQLEAAVNVEKAGWSRVVDRLKSPLGPSVDRTENEGRAMVERTGGYFKPLMLFRKNFRGEELFITLTEFSFAGRRISGCRLFDLGEDRPTSKEAVEKLMGRSATEQKAMGMTVLLWQPGFTPAQPNFEIWQVPAGSQPATENKFDGLMLRMESIGTIEQ